uniref:Uncharacterized protein n=1 Tax=Meloidogyne javanica TaxID=6303 RepID=A0A915MVD5_MELJA
MIQGRNTTISTIIPLFRVIIYALENDKNDFPTIKNAIIEGLKKRMEEKRDAKQNIKREAWNNNRDLILATMLDARFKMNYFEKTRHEEYINYLIYEAEKLSNIEVSESNDDVECPATTISNLFMDFEKSQTEQEELFGPLSPPVPSISVISTRQKAEIEVFGYLDHKTKKLKIDEDPIGFWTGENVVKWPLLTNLASKYFSAPATSSESE